MLFLSYGRDPRLFNHSCSLVFQCQVAWGTSGFNQNLNSLASLSTWFYRCHLHFHCSFLFFSLFISWLLVTPPRSASPLNAFTWNWILRLWYLCFDVFRWNILTVYLHSSEKQYSPDAKTMCRMRQWKIACSCKGQAFPLVPREKWKLSFINPGVILSEVM